MIVIAIILNYNRFEEVCKAHREAKEKECKMYLRRGENLCGPVRRPKRERRVVEARLVTKYVWIVYF
jgi:hypothetical protein